MTGYTCSNDEPAEWPSITFYAVADGDEIIATGPDPDVILTEALTYRYPPEQFNPKETP